MGYYRPRSARSHHQSRCMLPATWEDIRTAFKPDYPFPHFTNAQIVEYFVTRTVSDGLHVADFKSINKSALNLFR